MENFTEEELRIAKSVDLCDVAKSLGYTVKRVGRFHTLKEMDSVRIYDRTSWFRWSRLGDKGSNGGSQIDFLRVFTGMSVKDAVFWLLDFAGYRRYESERMLTNRKQENNKEINQSVATVKATSEKHKNAGAEYQKCENSKSMLKHINSDEGEEKREFVLPLRANGNTYIYDYLTRKRMIDGAIVDYLINSGLIYEEKGYHNIVFKGIDKDGVVRFASRRGVFDENREKPFKSDVAGSDKRYGFNLVTDSEEIAVFEGAIDLISYMDLYRDFESNKIALGMLSDEPLHTFLKEHPQIERIKVCLDNDEPGRTAAQRIVNKYKLLGYEVEDCYPPYNYKDYNDYLRDFRIIERADRQCR